ncbi:MAG: isoquinoline 1-oxidoreductase, partial [Pseudomonadota bacterium]
LSYCAMLGPEIRKRYVLDQAQVLESDFPCPIYGPAGLVLGGELPESVALSILSQAHAVLFGAIQQAVPDESELLERSTGT